jgi:5-methylcytosine-specific restriction endonuclease McrA
VEREEGMKRCSVCKEHKAREEFNRHVRRKDGLRSACKECEKNAYKKQKRNNEWAKRWEAKERDALTDRNIKQCIWRETKGRVKGNDITQEMIEEKRKSILDNRIRRKNGKKESKIVEIRRVCRICKRIFEPKGSSLFCSDKCRNIDSLNKYYDNHDTILEDKRNKWWVGREERKPFECKECGKIVIPTYENGNGSRKDFCSIRCSKRYRRRERGNCHKRRAEFYGSDYIPVNPNRVFIRDGWRCQICHAKLKRNDRGTFKELAPELDHIIPLSKGGEHSYKNTQCVCRKCNSEKGAREIGQLRMFG